MNKLKRLCFIFGLVPAMWLDIFVWIWTGRVFFFSNRLADWSQNVKR